MILAMIAAAALVPQTVATIDPKHRLVEGVASDGATIWASSLIDRQIIACKAERCKTIATLPSGVHPFAIAWDSKRKRLWVAADCPPGVSFIKACERGALIALDARGRIQTRIAPASGSFHPGDVSVANGDLFVSDSQNGAVYRLSPEGRALIAVVAPGIGKSGQGSALDAEGKRLIVADYSHGIAAIDLSSGIRTLLPRQDGKPLRGVDGLIRCGNGYLGIYNGAAPGRLLTINMREGGVEYGELVENLTFPDPTQIAFDGSRLLIVPNAGWEKALKGETVRAEGAPIVAIPVGPDCKPV
jgi:sugar lactone lactonase YvrE